MQTDQVIALICALRDALSARNHLEVVQQTVSRLSALDLDGVEATPLPPRMPSHFASELKSAIDHVPASLKAFADAVSQAAQHLSSDPSWRLADARG